MLHEVDAALSAFLAHHTPPEVTVTVETPTGGNPVEHGVPEAGALTLFLYDIRENPTALGANWTEVRDEHSRVVSRQLPHRRFQLSYLLTAHASTAQGEHRLLSDVLAAAAVHTTIAPEHLDGALAAARLPVELRVASPDAAARPWDLWAALRMPPRTCLDLQVTAVLQPDFTPALAPPAEHLVLDANPIPVSPRSLAEEQQERQWTTTRVRERRPTPPPDDANPAAGP